MEEDWDLQAIVRGCTSEFATAIMEESTQSTSFVPLDHFTLAGDDFLYDVSDYFDQTTTTSSAVNELDELYKPFYPHEQSIDDQQNSSMYDAVPNEIEETQDHLLAPVVVVSKSTSTVPKRRKNQHKRVVKEVALDDLSSDTWAWRKYGQKPIKGSPYPRSYYRCSSSKGCLARKQVERSSTNPTMFIISYTAEHNHTHPVRRNSLAGIAKKKYSIMKNLTTNDLKIPTLKKESSCCSPVSSSTVLSPTSSLTESDEFSKYTIKREKSKDDEQMIEECTTNTMCNNVFLSCYDGLDGITSDMSNLEYWFSDQISRIP